jgi:hypothetical protein
MKNRPWSPRHGTKNTVKIHEKFCFVHGRHIMEPRIQGKYMKKLIAEVTLQEKIYCKLPLVTVTDNLDRLILNRKSLIQSGHFSFVPNVDH